MNKVEKGRRERLTYGVLLGRSVGSALISSGGGVEGWEESDFDLAFERFHGISVRICILPLFPFNNSISIFLILFFPRVRLTSCTYRWFDSVFF